MFRDLSDRQHHRVNNGQTIQHFSVLSQVLKWLSALPYADLALLHIYVVAGGCKILLVLPMP